MAQTQPNDPAPVFSRRRRIIKSLKAQADSHRTPAERFADWLTNFFGSVGFLVINALWFFLWIIINLGFLPGVEPFDPFPFGLLTMVVSLEAIFLAIIVLISQNRAARIADLREEIDLQINTIAEEEVTKMIQLQLKLLEKNGVILEHDPDLERMLRPLQSAEIERVIQSQINSKKHF
ncbi:MAG TPA: DUF1003 domain-containing protein [Candidatus Saccharimonadales bacterium]|nr:DUF1003 domain-containing protein [Candidatus Saccharimonadales bacterium]